MLQKKDIEWVKENRALHTRKPRKPMSNRERIRYFRIRKNVKETLEAITTLVQNMPEQQLDQTFNKDNVAPFLKALFSLKSEDPQKKCARVLELWHFILMQHSSYSYVADLVGKERLKLLTKAGINPIQAIYVVATR